MVEYAEAKLLLTKLSKDVFGEFSFETQWPTDLESDLRNYALPMKRDKLELIDRFYRLPEDHPIFDVIQCRPSIKSLIRNLRWEPRMIRFALKKISFNERFEPA